MTKKDDIEPMSRKEWAAMKHSKDFIPSKAYDNYDFLKTLSLKKKPEVTGKNANEKV